MANYLDENGLQYVWNKIKGMFATIASPEFTGTPTAPTPATSDDSTKIATTAYVNNKVAGLDGATYELTQNQSDGHIITLTGSNGDTYTITIPDNDTTYNEATTSVSGLMSSTDKTKLDGVASGAQVNVLEGVKINGVALSISDKAVNVPLASSSANGAMSSTDKSKLDGFSDASNYALKTDITGIYKYKGSVADYEHLPSSSVSAGDVYDTQDTGMNYAWNGTAWDALGMSFSITSITNAQIDTICV